MNINVLYRSEDQDILDYFINEIKRHINDEIAFCNFIEFENVRKLSDYSKPDLIIVLYRSDTIFKVKDFEEFINKVEFKVITLLLESILNISQYKAVNKSIFKLSKGQLLDNINQLVRHEQVYLADLLTNPIYTNEQVNNFLHLFLKALLNLEDEKPPYIEIKYNKGAVFFNIPKTMTLNKTYECQIKISKSEILIANEKRKVNKSLKVSENVTITREMSVESKKMKILK
ncbi:MAG: hypothetical protein IPK25_15830 [Saprospiraceae bacterium]|nr:hypothetical protein [Saprospiraceae bacterium]